MTTPVTNATTEQNSDGNTTLHNTIHMIGGVNGTSPQLDPVTALQDTIDSFSLSLFEALRTLRDAVAPDSSQNHPHPINDGSTTNPTNPSTTNNDMAIVPHYHLSETDGDFEDFKTSLQMKDPTIMQILGNRSIPQNREQYAQMLLDVEREQDVDMVSKLADEVLEKSDKVNELVTKLPGMERGKEEQMRRIDELLGENWNTMNDLEQEYQNAVQIRKEVRNVLQKTTCQALGIEEEI